MCLSLRTVTSTSHESGSDCKQSRLQETEQVLLCHAPSLPSFSLSIPGCLLSIVSCLALHYLSSFIVVSAHVSPSSFTLYISLWSCWFVQHVSLLLHFYFTRSVFYLPVKSRTSTSHQMFWCASLFTCHQTRFLTRCLSCNRVSRSVKPTHGWQISSIDARRQKYDKYKMFPALSAVSNQSSETSVARKNSSAQTKACQMRQRSDVNEINLNVNRCCKCKNILFVFTALLYLVKCEKPLNLWVHMAGFSVHKQTIDRQRAL